VMVPLASGTITLLRERLHYLCSFGEPGTEAAGWTCPDGISYLAPGVILGGVAAITAVNGLLAVVLVREDRAARILLTLLAAGSAAAGLAGSWIAANSVQALPAGVEGGDYWIESVLPAAVAAVVSLAIAAAALAVTERPALVLSCVAAGGLLVATILQPGLAISMLPAIGLLLAAASRTDPPRPPSRSASEP